MQNTITKQIKSTSPSWRMNLRRKPTSARLNKMPVTVEKGYGLGLNSLLYVKYDYRFSGVCFRGFQRKTRHVSMLKTCSVGRKK